MDLNTIVVGLDSVVAVARYVLLGTAGLVGVVCAGDWLVRTRRLSPFGAPARFFRKAVDPAIAPIERVVVRTGGVPSSAPWWALVAVVIGGILVLTGLDALRGVIIGVLQAIDLGPRGIVALLVRWTFGILEFALIVRVLASWLPISPSSRWIRWSYTLTDWLVRPLRRRLPPFGMFDLSPVVAYAILWVAEWIITRVI